MNRTEYIKLLESAMTIDDEQEYVGPQTPIRKWDGNEPLPTYTTDGEELDLMVKKILKKEQDGTDLEDPNRDDNEPKDLKENEDCPDCEKAALELLKEMGLSPLDLLEMGEDQEEVESADVEKIVDGTEDDNQEVNIDINFESGESEILEQLLAEMSFIEEQETTEIDEFSDDIDA